jgi:arginase
VGAPSNLGIRPYEDGEARHVSRGPDVLRQRGLVSRLDATDLGDAVPPPYQDYVRPPTHARNEQQVLRYSRHVAERVAAAHGRFVVVIGGDCSVVLGCLLGAKRAAGGPIGLAYVDAHTDFATADESRTGSVAGMSLALAVGRGDTPLARLAGRRPLVAAAHAALIGHRDAAGAWNGHAALAVSPILELADHELLSRSPEDLAAVSLARVATSDVRGFWIQIDADVLNPAVMSAVDSPEPGGPLPDELVSLLGPLVHDPLALGLSLTTYDPALDPDRSCARQLVTFLETLLR